MTLSRQWKREGVRGRKVLLKRLQVLLNNVGLGQNAIGALNSGLTSGSETELSLDAVDAVGGVDVLDEGELPAGGTTLARGDCRGSQEVLPDLVKVSKIKDIGPSSRGGKCESDAKLTRNHLLPYLASTLSLLPIQLRYQRHKVAE